jgi:PhnB protein
MPRKKLSRTWPFVRRRYETQQNQKEAMDLKTNASGTKSSNKARKTGVKPIPDGMHAITPHLVCAGAADAIEFYKKAFDAVELVRLPGPNGKLIHAGLRIRDSVVMLVDEFPEWGSRGPKSLNGSPVTIHLYVDDVDAVMKQAVQAGAKITMPLEDTFWGDRYGQLEDPFGHSWSLATHIRDVGPEEMQKAAEEMSR